MHSFSDPNRKSAVDRSGPAGSPPTDAPPPADAPPPTDASPTSPRAERPRDPARAAAVVARPGRTGPAARVAFFATCLADRFFAEACADAVRVLEHFGVRVTVPPDQTCCGQPAYNTGRREEAARMARHTARVFAGAEHVVLPSGSCAGMMRSFYPGLLRGQEGLHAGPAAPEPPIAERVYELAEYLVRVLGVLASGAPLGTGLTGRRIVYHHGCHALRELGVRDEPVALLRACGAEVLPWDGDTECCGFGGLFSTKFPEVSAGMADRKLDALPPDVDLVTSADGGCLLQLSGRWTHRVRGGGSAGPTPGFVHLATLLREGLGLRAADPAGVGSGGAP